MPLILTIGPPGSGKTTWMRESFGPQWLKLDLDAVRVALFGSKQEYFNSPFEPKVRNKVLVWSSLQAIRAWPNRKVVLCATNLYKLTSGPFLREFSNEEVKGVLFDVPWSELEKRNAERSEDDRVPPEKLIEYYNTYIDPNAWFRKELKLFTPETL